MLVAECWWQNFYVDGISEWLKRYVEYVGGRNVQREYPPRSCTKIFMVRIKTEVPLFLIVYDLLFQMQKNLVDR